MVVNKSKSGLALFLSVLNLFSPAANFTEKHTKVHSGIITESVTFIENKGQVRDQNHECRPDVLFSGMANGMVYHLRNNGISYQLTNRKDNQSNIYRVDLNWMNVNKNIIIQTEGVLKGFDNYYTGSVPVLNVKSYSGVIYKNIYNNIDLHYYAKEGQLKYDFIVAPNSDYKQIKLRVDGAEHITMQRDGSLILRTPMGDISEGTPLVYQNGKKIEAHWQITGNFLCFDITGYDPSLPLLIDPLTRVWGTYYGGTGGFGASLTSSVRTDLNGNVYMAGNTDASSGTSIATTGSHQTTNGGSFDTYLVKFNSAGVRQWATYYGGTGFESSAACSIDASGNIYFSGQTDSQTNISTPSSHQAVYGGGASDYFLVKFNSGGVRLWATYYGGSASDGTTGNTTIDNNGDIYICGDTKSSNGISTPGCHQPVYAGSGSDRDGFVAKFNSNGIRLWGTYYGGSGEDLMIGTCNDASGNLFVSGSSVSTAGISSVGSYQAAFGGGTNDAFLVKFNSSGVRQWATYYGDAAADDGERCGTDLNGDVYLVGKTASTNGITTVGSYQTVYGGGATDAYIVKFSGLGVRLWGTYFGGTDSDGATACVTDPSGYVVVTGLTKSTSNIGTTGSYQSVFGGGTQEDALLVKFSTTGLIQWGTYYGGSGRESGEDVAIDASGKLYMGGLTGTSGGTVIATAGSHQSGFVGGNDGFLVQFTDCNAPTPPVNTTAVANLTLCSNNSTTVSATASGAVNWYNTASSPIVLGTGNTFVTPALGSGTYTFFAGTTNTCSPSGRTAVTITVNPLITINSGAICQGGSFTMTAGGVTSFTFMNGSAIVTPNTTSNYTVTGTDQNGCTGTAVNTVVVNALPAVSVNSGSICSGNTFTILPAGANTYTISGIVAYVSPTVTSSYTVTGANASGCIGTAISTVVVHTTPGVTAVTSRSVICKGKTAVLTASGAATYSWSNGSSSSSITVSPTITTVYNVTGTGTNSCAKKVTITQSVSACTGIDEGAQTEPRISIFPNPTTGVFTVINKDMGINASIEVFNSLGQLIMAERADRNGNSFDLNKNANGVYLIKLTENDRVLFFKLIKNN